MTPDYFVFSMFNVKFIHIRGRTMKKTLTIILAAVVAAILLRFLYSQFGQLIALKMQGKRPAPEVAVEEVGEESIIRSFEAPGRVVSKYRIEVGARIEGYLQKSYFKEGDFVKAGQVLFLIEPTQYSNAANVAAANVASYKSKLDYAQKQYQRAKELVAKDFISKAQYDSLLSERDSVRAALASAQAQYADANRNLNYTRVKSQVDGQVGIINVTVGNYVSPASGVLTTINSTNPMYVTFPLEINDFTLLAQSDGKSSKNRKVELILPGDQPYKITGVQDFQDNKIDQSTGTVTMRATFENPDNELIHGEFVTVRVYSNNPVRLPVVPQVAVQENPAGKYVYKLDENDLPQLVYIKTGSQLGDHYVVNEGLKKGDRVVVNGIQKVTPGKAVKIVNGEP
jgi:membrane fusion protein (multidrug efflux system)